MQKKTTTSLTTPPTDCCSVVGHVTRSGAEFGVGFNDLVDGVEEVLFCGHLAARANSKHARLGTYAPDFSACAYGNRIQK